MFQLFEMEMVCDDKAVPDGDVCFQKHSEIDDAGERCYDLRKTRIQQPKGTCEETYFDLRVLGGYSSQELTNMHIGLQCQCNAMVYCKFRHRKEKTQRCYDEWN